MTCNREGNYNSKTESNQGCKRKKEYMFLSSGNWRMIFGGISQISKCKNKMRDQTQNTKFYRKENGK